MTQDRDHLLTVEQTAAYLQMAEDSVRRMLRTGRLPGYRLGGRRTGWRVKQSELDAWLESRRALDGGKDGRA
jgi:excisionase family DNA binding protein